jgi:hypothetical protein
MVNPLNPKDFPEACILWQRWSAATEAELAQRDRPVLLFVADPEPMVFMFLRAIFQAMSANARRPCRAGDGDRCGAGTAAAGLVLNADGRLAP